MINGLRDSGVLEDNADVVILLHRENAYEKDSPRAGEADFIVAKHRHGPPRPSFESAGHWRSQTNLATAQVGSPPHARRSATGPCRSRLYLVRMETPTPGKLSGRAGNSRSGRHGCIDRGTGAARAGNTETRGSSAPPGSGPQERYARRALGPRRISAGGLFHD
jgi:hypothetical protein